MVPIATTSVTNECTTDAELLARFVTARDQKSFAALAQRFAPLIWRVCVRVAGQRQDAEDAFQETLCILAKRAGSIRRPESLASWLYGIAYRTSVRIRGRRRARRECEFEGELAAPAPPRAGVDERAGRILHEELSLLPRKYREPLVQRYLLERSVPETANALELSTTVVKGRLQRARSELRARLAARGIVGLSLAILTVDFTSECQAGAIVQRLFAESGTAAVVHEIQATTTAATPAAGKGIVLMRILIETVSVAGCVLAVSLALPARSATPPSSRDMPTPQTSAAQLEPAIGGTVRSDASNQIAAAVGAPAAPAAKEAVILKYDDDTPDGKKSMAGTGEMIHFSAPGDQAALTGIELHGSRYGHPQAPREDFKIYVLSGDRKHVLHTELSPYSRFERGEAKWVLLKFAQAVDVPREFWIVVDFNAEATKGVYVSYDSSTGGEHSMVGLPGKDAKKANFGGDWMIRAQLAK